MITPKIFKILKFQTSNNSFWSEENSLQTFDKFYNEKGVLVHDEGGENGNLFVVDSEHYQKGFCEFGDDCEALSNFLRTKALRAYRTEEAAAKDWAKTGYAMTREDNLERASIIVVANAVGDPYVKELYVLGKLVKGWKSKKANAKQEVDPLASKAILNETDLVDHKYYTWKKQTTKKYGHYNTPPMVKWGWVDNPETTKMVPEANNYWRIVGFVHTHPRGDEDFSVNSGGGRYGQGLTGDMSFAIDGYNVYLVPTTHEKLYYMYRINAEDFKGWWPSSQTKAKEYQKKVRDGIWF